MSSKRALRRRACGKVEYSETEARAAAWQAYRRGHRVTAYRCRWCNSWHIGHPPRRVRQALAARRKAER